MARLFCVGVGYTAHHFLAAFGHRFERVHGTVRSHAKAAALTGGQIGDCRPDIMLFDGVRPSTEVKAALEKADFLLATAAPTAFGDPLLSVFGEVLARARKLQCIVYLSSASVYGDRGGGLVDEAAALAPHSERGRLRVAAEHEWIALSRRTGRPLAVLRLSGIYGPGRNVLERLARGAVERIIKPGQVFNRIHVADIAQSINSAFERRADGVFNVTDDEAAPPEDVVAFAAGLMGVTVPDAVSFEDAQASMTAMSRSFYQENKRLLNRKLKAELGVRLIYPTYREGLRALYRTLGR